MSDTYADWTPDSIRTLLSEYEDEWRESLPWPILDLIQRYVAGRLIDRNSIDNEAAEDLYLYFVDETERGRYDAEDYDEVKRQARAVVNAALGIGDER